MYSASSDTNVTQLTGFFRQRCTISEEEVYFIDVNKADDKIPTSGATLRV